MQHLPSTHTPIKKLVALLIIFITISSGHSGNSETDSKNESNTGSSPESATAPARTSTEEPPTPPPDIHITAFGSADEKLPDNDTVVCLSPGHPSYEGDKLYEAIINRKVAWLLAMQLLESDINVVFAVEDVPPDKLFFSDLSNDDAQLVSHLKVMTPEEKANRCNDAGADYLISIHHNFAYSGEMNQTMVFYTLDENYRPLHNEAKSWAATTAKFLGKVMKTDDSYAIADLERIGFPLGILTNASMPGILTEASFYSNPKERARLNDDAYLATEAEAIFNAFTAQFQ